MGHLKDEALSYGCSFLTVIFGQMSAQELVSIIYTVLGIVSFIISIAFSIKKWYTEAMKDGKIDEKEKEEFKNIVKGGIKEGKDLFDDINKNKKGE